MQEQTTFSIRLKELRSSLNMTQVQFANHVGTNQVTLSSYETGATNPSLEIVKEIATKCNVSIDWLCGLSNKKNLNNEYSTYYDVLKDFVQLCSVKYDDGSKNLVTASIVNSSDNIHFIVKNDDIFNSFFTNWLKMYNLLQENVINSEIYTQWLEGELSRYNNHPINGVPFW